MLKVLLFLSIFKLILENYRDFFFPQLGTPQECDMLNIVIKHVFIILYYHRFYLLVFNCCISARFLFFFFLMDKVVTSSLIIVQHQLPAGNCSFRCPTMAKLFLCSRLGTEKALSQPCCSQNSEFQMGKQLTLLAVCTLWC